MEFTIAVTPRAEREILISDRVKASEEKGPPIYNFRGKKHVPVKITLDIKTPIYRMANCRVYATQQSVIAKKKLPEDHFVKGQESSSVQEEQHRILKDFAKKGTSNIVPIYDVLAKDGQQEPILITHTGVVVNGNRRLAAMRELFFYNDGSVNSNFSHVECAVLPVDTNADEIEDIEADLQARPETKLDYDWIGDAQLIKIQSLRGRSPKEIADRLSRKKVDIENRLQAFDEVDLYLREWLKKPGQYDLVSGDAEQIFTDLPKKLKNKTVELQNFSRIIAWTLFENKDRITGRLYAFNSAFGELVPQVIERLAEDLEFENDSSQEEEDSDDFFFEMEEELDSILSYEKLFENLQDDNTKEETVSTLIDTCETIIERAKGVKSEKAALKSLSTINSKLAGVDISTAGQGTLLGIQKQLASIRNSIEKIGIKLTERLSKEKPN